jgi:hypothetical protein
VEIARRLEMAGREDKNDEFAAALVELQIELTRAVAELDEMVVVV